MTETEKTLTLRLFRLEDVPNEILQFKLKALRAAFAKDYPTRAPLPIVVPVLSDDPQAGIGSGVETLNRLRQLGGGDTPAMFMIPVMQVKERMAIVVHPEALSHLITDELLFFVAHEAGHYYRRHLSTRSLAVGQTARLECEADQFAAHYIQGADALMLSASRRWHSLGRAGRDPGLMEMEFFNWITTPRYYVNDEKEMIITHPTTLDRITMMARKAITDLKPGSVEFNSQCQPLNGAEAVAPTLPEGIKKLRHEIGAPPQ